MLVGLSQRTAPVTLRERLSKMLESSGCADETTSAIPSLIGSGFREFAHLSTCNRLEIYAVSNGTHSHTRELIASRLAELGGISPEELEPHIYHWEDADAVRHLLRVASGLDSQMLGETQILGQVSEAFASARTNGTSGPLLTYLFSRAAHAGKRARSETEISKGGTSISQAAVSLLEKELGDLSSRNVLVVGAGDTVELAVQALHKRGAPKVCCVNRTLSSAQALASRFGCLARPWGELAGALMAADAVITATGSPHPVIYLDDVAPILEQRRGTPLVFVDIAVPRDVDLEVGSLPGVVLHDIDQLEAALDRNLGRRFAAVPDVEDIVAQETQVVMDWLHGREATHLVSELRKHAKSVADAEVGIALRKLGSIDENAQEIILRMANRIVSKCIPP
ncbi:MAG: glutamyl-tRNA reductase, partial [Actinobacteria bacterium]|nr:glutamyl-tRNA reductase [Actinomycetota bacterium]